MTQSVYLDIINIASLEFTEHRILLSPLYSHLARIE